SEAYEKARAAEQARLAAAAEAEAETEARLAAEATEKARAADQAGLAAAATAEAAEDARLAAEATGRARAAEHARLAAAAKAKADKEARLAAEATEKARAAEQARLAAAAAAKAKADEEARLAAEKARAAEIAQKAQQKEDVQAAMSNLPSLRILFDSEGNSLTAASYDVLKQVADVLLDYPDTEVIVEGYTDATGDPQRNMDLSLRRATTVRDYLIQQGVSIYNVRAIGLGAANPLVSNATPEGRAINRRIEFTFR
ncbi:MAG: OmpA family protein, partial [Granulosicoccus sp.]